MKKIMLLVILIILFPVAYAKEGHITLLAVKEVDSGLEGSTADLSLEIKSGSGRVFLDTFPLTKMDTQISTRFAKEIACDYIDFDCNRYDFIFTITADSTIIGGPSAGAAATMLAISLLQDISLDKSTAITGTINSGGLIGPVGGVKAKIDAASKSGIKKVLIPKGERFIESEPELAITNNTIAINLSQANETLDLVEYGKKSNIVVVEVSDINDVIYEFTGKKIKEPEEGLVIDEEYQNTMNSLALMLCNRSNYLETELSKYPLRNEEMIGVKESAINLTKKADMAYKNNSYYSSASYCFGANVKYSYLISFAQNQTKEKIAKEIDSARKRISEFNDRLSKKKKKTITDLEVYAVVKERLIEADYYLNSSSDDDNLYNIAYATERISSADSWMRFFDNRGKRFDLDKDVIKKLCQKKLSEAEERYQYVNLFFPAALEDTKRGIDYAYSDLGSENYELCIFKASQAKAEADVILSTVGIEKSQLDELIGQKMNAAKRNIISQTKKGIFPIVGYSYYEYANDLKQTDKYSALIYLEYALELSNLDIYLKEEAKEKKEISYHFDRTAVYLFISGILIGFLIAVSLKRRKQKAKKHRKKH